MKNTNVHGWCMDAPLFIKWFIAQNIQQLFLSECDVLFFKFIEMEKATYFMFSLSFAALIHISDLNSVIILL